MLPSDMIEKGKMGRVAHARIAPNEDLVLSIEKLCLAAGFRHAFVRGGLGSLVDACLGAGDGSCITIKGPGLEIVSLAGEIRPQTDGALHTLRAALSGVVVDTAGQVYGGPFMAGLNLVCMTFEITLEEWLPEAIA